MAGTSDIAVIEVRGRNNDHLTRDASCTPLGLESRRDNLQMSHRLAQHMAQVVEGTYRGSRWSVGG